MGCVANVEYVVRTTKYTRPFPAPCKVSSILKSLGSAFKRHNIAFAGGRLEYDNGETVKGTYVGAGTYRFAGFEATKADTLPNAPGSCLSVTRKAASVRDIHPKDATCLNVYYNFGAERYMRPFAATCPVSYIMARLRVAFNWKEVEFVGGYLERGDGAVIEDEYVQPGDYWFVGYKVIKFERLPAPVETEEVQAARQPFSLNPTCINVYYTFENKTYLRPFTVACPVSYISDRIRSAFDWKDIHFNGGHLERENGGVVESEFAEPRTYRFVGFKTSKLGEQPSSEETCNVM
jgi:hypothetical protein